jgi:HK97 family phage prohead protease
MSDVIMQYNHEGRVFARTRNNTLSLTSDEHGLLIEADLGGTEIGRQLFDEIDGGYTDRMSFGFTVDADEVSEEREKGKRTIYLRTITRIGKLYDVSAVSIPANDGTEISARSLVDGLIEKEKAERLIEAEKEARARAKAELELELELIRR